MNEHSISDMLEDLLDRERVALLAGDLGTVARLAEEKERLVQSLEGSGHGALADLQEKASRNQELLHSAVAGIRAVAERLAALREARETFSTYDSSGRRLNVHGQNRNKIEKRA